MKRVPSGVAAAANLGSPAAQIAAAEAALGALFGGETSTSLPPASSAATMEMIAEASTRMVAEVDGSAELLAASAAASQA